jgi:hypothetical protein
LYADAEGSDCDTDPRPYGNRHASAVRRRRRW